VSRPKIYLDEDVYAAVAVGLRRRGFDVLTTIEAGRRSCGDGEQLRFASAEGRVLVTFNRGDFARLHGEHLASGEQHCGVIVSRQAGIGPVVRALSRLLGGISAASLGNRFIWLTPR
jgi:hypothetical protein